MRKFLAISVVVFIITLSFFGCKPGERVTWNGGEWELIAIPQTGSGKVASVLWQGEKCDFSPSPTSKLADLSVYSLLIREGVQCSSLSIPFKTNGGAEIQFFAGSNLPKDWAVSTKKDSYLGQIVQMSGPKTETLAGEVLTILDRGTPRLIFEWIDGWTFNVAKKTELVSVGGAVWQADFNLVANSPISEVEINWTTTNARVLCAMLGDFFPVYPWLEEDPALPAQGSGKVTVYNMWAKYIGPAPVAAPNRFQLLSQKEVGGDNFIEILFDGKKYSGKIPNVNPPKEEKQATTWGSIKKR